MGLLQSKEKSHKNVCWNLYFYYGCYLMAFFVCANAVTGSRNAATEYIIYEICVVI